MSKLWESLLWKLLAPSLAVAWDEGNKARAGDEWVSAVYHPKCPSISKNPYRQ